MTKITQLFLLILFSTASVKGMDSSDLDWKEEICSKPGINTNRYRRYHCSQGIVVKIRSSEYSSATFKNKNIEEVGAYCVQGIYGLYITFCGEESSWLSWFDDFKWKDKGAACSTQNRERFESFVRIIKNFQLIPLHLVSTFKEEGITFPDWVKF